MRIRFGSRAAGVRPPAVAGRFYPADPRALAGAVDAFVDAPREPLPRPGCPKALVVPHAGYPFSGPVAGSAYALLKAARGKIRRVVLLGPCHRVAVRGLALPEAEALETPLGRVPLDRSAAAALDGLPQVVVSSDAHAAEHSLEVQLPFLQAVLGDFTLVPLVVGRATKAEVREVIERLWGGDETLVIASSDLSHYLSYDQACVVDRETVDGILAGVSDIDHDQACGATPVAGLVEAARAHGLEAELLDLRNSGDTSGDRDRVVGYASIAYWEPGQARYGREHGEVMTELARSAIASALGLRVAPVREAAWLAAPRATFVTLTCGGRLRGCVGSLEARRTLAADLAANAKAAAFGDPRFEPVEADELDSLRIEVSVLSEPAPLAFRDHDDLVAQLRPGEDGLLLEARGRRATYLPQVWEGLPDADDFVSSLKRKAGLPATTPTEEFRAWRYRTWKWREGEGGDRRRDARSEGLGSVPCGGEVRRAPVRSDDQDVLDACEDSSKRRFRGVEAPRDVATGRGTP